MIKKIIIIGIFIFSIQPVLAFDGEYCEICHFPIPISVTPVPIHVLAPMPTSVPIPDYDVKLWEYTMTCSRLDFLGVCNPSSYIMPDSPVIKYYSDKMFINGKGDLEWKEQTYLFYMRAGILSFTYQSDMEKWGKSDFWVNPDYFLMYGESGDCEDIALVVASILEEKDIPSRVVGGYLIENNGERFRDWSVEYKLNGTYYIFLSGVNNNIFLKRDEFYNKKDIAFEPLIMFGKNGYYTDYDRNW